jgi:hypothetical protein
MGCPEAEISKNYCETNSVSPEAELTLLYSFS